jgi:ketosteroid isomerase-like protein
LLDREFVINILKKYGEAWKTKNPSLIVSIFTNDAVYHEQILSAPIIGRRNIGRYWRARVVRGQDNIEFTILNVYIDGWTVIAEWEARFDVVARSERKLMREVAILEFRGDLICSLREYWSSKNIGRIRNRHARPWPNAPGKRPRFARPVRARPSSRSPT